MAYGDPGAARDDGATLRARLARHARPALAGLLLIVVILGYRAGLPASAASGPWHAHGFVLAASLDIILAAMLALVQWRRRRGPQSGHPAAELRIWLKNILVLAVPIITVFALLFLLNVKIGPIRARPVPLKATGKTPKLHLPPPGTASSDALGANLLYAVIALLVLAAIAGCLYLLWLRRRTIQPAGHDPEVDMVADDAALRAAVASGRSALQAVDDARAAIIACYTAMETRLAGAGTARTVAETPDELLGRAQRSGLLRGQAAAGLVVLFYEARFSTHPLPATARADAAQALDALSAELRTSQEKAAAAAGPAGGSP